MDTNCRVVILLVLASIASVSSIEVIHRYKFEEGLHKLIEKCKSGDVESLPLPAPSLKRLEIPPINSEFSGFAVSTSVIFVDGLELMSVETLTASESRLSILMEITVPRIKIHADWYSLRGSVLGFISINDKGLLKAHVDNLRVKVETRFASKDNDTVISNLDLSYSFGNVGVSLEASNFIINNVVNAKVRDIVNSRDFKDNVKNNAITMLQSHLRGHTPEEFIKIISAI